MLVDDVITRIDALDTDLKGRVEGAAELSQLIKENALPQQMPAAFVLPLGLRGGEADAATGIFRQTVDEVVAVVIIVEAAGDVAGQRALSPIATLATAIINAVCGWAPGNQVGVFRLLKGALLSVSNGAVIYQLDFAIQDQLRIEG